MCCADLVRCIHFQCCYLVIFIASDRNLFLVLFLESDITLQAEKSQRRCGLFDLCLCHGWTRGHRLFRRISAWISFVLVATAVPMVVGTSPKNRELDEEEKSTVVMKGKCLVLMRLRRVDHLKLPVTLDESSNTTVNLSPRWPDYLRPAVPYPTCRPKLHTTIETTDDYPHLAARRENIQSLSTPDPKERSPTPHPSMQ